MAVLHWHHIVPKHAGGTDDPTNLIQVTVEEHAELHFARYLEYGELGDWVAAFTLSGQMSRAEAIAEARADWIARNPEHHSNAGRKGGRAPATATTKASASRVVRLLNASYPHKACPHCGWTMRANLLNRHIKSKHTHIKVQS